MPGLKSIGQLYHVLIRAICVGQVVDVWKYRRNDKQTLIYIKELYILK